MQLGDKKSRNKSILLTITFWYETCIILYFSVNSTYDRRIWTFNSCDL